MDTPAQLKQLIQTKTQGIASQKILWERLLQRAIPEAILVGLVEEFNTPHAAERFIDLLLGQPSDPLDTWNNIQIDATEIGVDFGNYLKALEAFLNHPKTHDCDTSLDKIMGYLACSREVGGRPMEFSHTVETMLDEYGFANE